MVLNVVFSILITILCVGLLLLIFNNICVLLAGRLASVKQFGGPGIDTGAANDLEAATQQAYTAIASLGMDEEIGFVHAETLIRNVNPELFSTAVEARIGQWLKEAGIKTEALIEQIFNPRPEDFVEENWYAFWSPFRSEIAANGFISKLQETTGIDYRVVKVKTGIYEVAFAYVDEADIQDKLARISTATGLNMTDS